MYKLIRALEEVDEYTRREVDKAIEHKLDEVAKIRGQIAKDLRRLGGVDGFQTEQCYRRLREKYLRGHQSRKKLALLEMERQKWCE